MMSDDHRNSKGEEEDSFNQPGSSSTIENHQHQPPINSRRRPKSTHRTFIAVSPHHGGSLDLEPEDFKDASILTTKSLLENAAEEQDFNTIKEGLNVAFGTKDTGESNWFPMHDKKDHINIPSLTIDTSNAEHALPMKSPARSFLNPFYDSSSHLNFPNTPISTKSGFTRDLEHGPRTPTFAINDEELIESPYKIANLITKVSDRITGTGASALPQSELSSRKSPSSRDDNHSLRTIRSDLMLDGNHSSTSVNLRPQVSLDGSTPSLSQSVEEVHEAIDDDLKGFDRIVPGQEGNSSTPTAFENVPFTNKVINTNVSHIWKTELSSMYLFGNSLKIFSPQNKFRQLCHTLLANRLNNTFFLVILILQTSLLSYRQWNPSHSGYVAKGYNWADYVLMVINFIYTVEMVLKIIAYGFYDDEIMFKELNLPYPKSLLKTKLLEGSWIIAIKGYFKGLFLIVSKRRSHKRPSYKKASSDDSYIDDIELEDQSPPSALGPSHFKSTRTDTFILQPKHHNNIDTLHIRRAYIRNSWHRIDFISIVCFWLSLFLSAEHYDAEHNILIFRALSCLHILRLCNLTRGTSLILKALKVSIPDLVDVTIFIGCFGLFFGIIGVQSFKSSFRRHCVWYNPDDPSDTFINLASYCGSYLADDGTARPYIFSNGEASSSIKGFRCPINSRCETLENPYEGTVNFDNIFNSLEQVFILMSANTFTDMMYTTMNTDSLTACLYFIFGIFIMTVWLLNVFIALVVTSFNVTRDSAKDEKKNREGILAPAGDPLSMHKELIDELKRQNSGLKLYYRFEFLFPNLILCDLIVQCLRSEGMTAQWAHTLYRIEASFTLLFVAEIILRFALYLPKWRVFFKLKRNRFDLFLAVITGIIIIGPIKEALGHAYYWLTVFQIMRMYRVVLATSYTRNLWLKIMGNIRQLIDLTLFYFLLTYLISIIYARFFEGVITADQNANFDFQTLPNTFVGLYTITSTENWTSILYLLQGHQNTPSARVFSAMLVIGWFMISNMVILNIFIAVIANTLNVPEAEKKKKQLLQFIENITASLQHVDNESGALSKYKNKFFKRKGLKEESQQAVVNLLLSGTAVTNFLNDHDINSDEEDEKEVETLPRTRIARFLKIQSKRFSSILDNPFTGTGPMKTIFNNPVSIRKKVKHLFNDPFTVSKPKIGQLSNFDPTTYAQRILSERNELINRQNEYLRANPTYNNVFYVIGPRHFVRRFCQRIVNSSYGERIDGVEPHRTISGIFTISMFIASMALVITACYLTPLYRSEINAVNGAYNWAFWIDVCWICIFSTEFSIRVLADGFSLTPNAYCRSPWNILDLLVLISLWIDYIAFLEANGELSRFISGVKALRALRLLTISETAKNTFHNTTISGKGVILNAAVMSLCLLFPFAIWALNIFNGRLATCLDGTSTKAQCINEYENEVFNWDIMSPNVYGNPLLHFDYFGQSLATLFEITSLEGWTDLLINVMQSTGIGTPPSPFASPINGVFVVFYNFIGIVFILTLFISVIIQNYSLTTGRAYMTVDQKSWYQVKKFLLQVNPSKRENSQKLGAIRRFCYKMTIEKNQAWLMLLNLVLFLHVLALLLEKYPSDDSLNIFRYTIYVVASLLFTANASMLLIAKRFEVSNKTRWNIFNLLVSLGALITTVIGFFVSAQSAFININKLFLVGTLLFVIPRSDRLSQFLRFASASLPNLISLIFTWCIFFLVFAIALNQIFGTTKIGANGSDNINVRTVPKALILLFRCSFGEGWNYIMDDYKLEWPYCSTDDDIGSTDCGDKHYAYVLFFSWNIISMYILLNMFISLILDSFSYIMNKGEYSKLIERSEIRKFKRAWQVFDTEGTGFISPKELPKFLHSLDGVLSFHFYHGELEIPILCKKWFKRLNSQNPYDIEVKYDEIEKSFNEWDIEKIRERRKSYEIFIEEALLNMELNKEPGISFKRILLQLPLYKTFEAGTCLNLIDFLERTLLLQKVEKRLHQNRVYETISAYICRWKYVENKKKGIRSDDIKFDSELRRRSYLTGDRSPLQRDRFDNEFEQDFGDLPKDLGLDLGPSTLLKPNARSTAYYDDADEDNPSQELDKSGVYVPKSPINIFKRSRPRSASPVHDTDSITESTNNEATGLLDISRVGETLRHSPWGETLKELDSSEDRD